MKNKMQIQYLLIIGGFTLIMLVILILGIVKQNNSKDNTNNSSSSTTSSTSFMQSSSNAEGQHCGGFIANAATCPSDFHCKLNLIADTGGVCVKN